jgi:O-antigen/teichoic acid export membrane protein
MYSFAANFLQKKFNFDAHYFLKGGFWLTLTQVIVVLAGIITTSLFAHYLSETDYGIYRYLIGLAVLFSSFSLTGLGQSILQTAAKKYYRFYQETIRLNFLYSLSITAISLGGAIYYFINENIILSLGCVLIAIFQPIINGFQNTQAFLQGSRRFREATIAQGIKVLVVSLLCVATLFFTKNVITLLLMYLGSNALVNIIFHLVYRPKQAPTTPEDISLQYVAYAKSTSIRNIISSISNRLDTVLIFTQLGAAELAVYTIATIIPEQIKASFKNLASLLLPKYAKHENVDVLKRSVPKRSLQLFLLLLAVTILYIIAAPYVYELLFPKYQTAILLSQISALAFPTFILYIPYSILQSRLAESELHKITLYSSIFQVVTIFGFIFFFGLLGAIIARLLYRIIFMLTVYVYFHKIKTL